MHPTERTFGNHLEDRDVLKDINATFENGKT